MSDEYIWVVDKNGFGGEILLKDYLKYLEDKKTTCCVDCVGEIIDE
jgi:predicted glycosyltransferase|tara:strand:- start:2132 stop:2269 length:138 start_codon:yes stop_codon:yes gene_type:complete